MKTKHTPGPWEIGGNPYQITGNDGFPILRIRGGMTPVPADARLIAAAPDMLAALQAVSNIEEFRRYFPAAQELIRLTLEKVTP